MRLFISGRRSVKGRKKNGRKHREEKTELKKRQEDMKQNLKNEVSGGSRLFNRFAAEKKKTVIAVCLIIVMVFMWVRVIGRKGPQSAKAADVAEGTDGQMNSELKISFIELPKVTGRNDVLTRDFFTVGDWWDFVRDKGNSSGAEAVSIVSGDGSEETIKRAAAKLKLEAIVMGEYPQAFINDKLLSAGDKLPVRDGVETYECEVTKIEGNTVLIRCGGAEVTLRLTQPSIIGYERTSKKEPD